MLAVGNDELREEVCNGDTVRSRHNIKEEYTIKCVGSATGTVTIGFISKNGEDYLVAVNGRLIDPWEKV